MAKHDENPMRRAVMALPEPVRAVFELHAVEELDYAAIAVRLGIDIAEVEARLAEAIVRIDRHLRDEERADPDRR